MELKDGVEASVALSSGAGIILAAESNSLTYSLWLFTRCCGGEGFSTGRGVDAGTDVSPVLGRLPVSDSAPEAMVGSPLPSVALFDTFKSGARAGALALVAPPSFGD